MAMLAKTEPTPTDEQIDIIDHVTNTDANFTIRAYAGTGKSSTLRLVCDAADQYDRILYLVFNKSARMEADAKFDGTRATIKTLNGLGHGIWAKTVANISLNTKKCPNILKEIIDGLKGEAKQEAREAYFDVLAGVEMAKAIGYIPDGKYLHARRLTTRDGFQSSLETIPSEITTFLIDKVLLASIALAYKGVIDFNDQIYMPALFGGSFPRFPLVLIDEGQDLNACNHEMLRKLRNSRLGLVGDNCQSIYAFRGAVTGGMDRFTADFRAVQKTISVSFRCPQAIVENARWRVPEFKWSKPGGRVETLPILRSEDIQNGAAIICRNNAPLFRLAFHLLSNKRSVSVAGSDIGPKIISLLKKIGSEADTRADLLVKIEGWRQEQLERTQSTATVNDKADCLRVFADYGRTVSEAVAFAEKLFKQQGTIRLMTGHKAKGLEFSVVYHLDPWIIGKGEQEDNLRYVIQTRSQDQYYEINSKDIR